ncbi:MAG: tRNA dimethylallyltransferase [Fimbriimonadales bacterium]
MRADLVVILGPTASGKTATAIRLAEAIGGEIVSADSMQVYRGLDIGTAKPTREERARVPFHLLDVVEVDEDFTVVDFQRLAARAVDDIRSRGRVPILCGGTGFYIRAFLEGFTIDGLPSDPVLRQRLDEEARQHGTEVLHARLAEVDPEAADKIGRNDRFRIVRALEVCEAGGRPFSSLQTRKPIGLTSVKVGLSWSRPELYRRIDERAAAMLAAGWLQETRDLLSKGYVETAVAKRALGYRRLFAHLKGEITLDEALEMIRRDTRRYAKRQMTWFRKEPNVNWISAETDGPDVWERVLPLLHS